MHKTAEFCNISYYMNETYDLKRFGADKIAFLGMFIISILIAQFVVSINSTLELSEPVELAHAGLSISIPTGNGWQTTKQWKYENNVFILSSNLLTNPGLPVAAVNCRYFFKSQNMTLKTLLNQHINDPNAAFVKTGEIQKGNVTIQWAHLEQPFSVFIGVAELPNNRSVTIEVFQTIFEIDIVERVFKQVTDSLDFREDNPLKTGTEIVTDIQSKGLNTLIDTQNQMTCFFIQDSGNRNIGFNIDLLGNSTNDEQYGIRGASQLFFTGRNPQEQLTLFQCDKNLGTYTWQSRTITRNMQIGTKIFLNKSGTINVANQIYDEYDEKSYLNGSKIVPSIFLELLISRIVQNNVKEAVVDIIDGGGRISPAFFSFKPADSNSVNSSNTVTLEFLDGRTAKELFYLDDENRIIKTNGEYNLKRTDTDSIDKEFPGQTGFITQQKKLLGQGEL